MSTHRHKDSRSLWTTYSSQDYTTKAQYDDLVARVAALEGAPASGVALQALPTPNVPMPARGTSITDSFGSRVWAVSASRHGYALFQAWNVGIGNDSRILLGFSPGSAHLLLGVPPYTDTKTMQVPNGASWSATDPWVLYGYQGNAIVSMDIRIGTFNVVKDFGSLVSIGDYEGGWSDDGTRVALSAGGRLIVWDMTGREVSSVPLPSGIDGFQISRKGQYVVLRAGNTRRHDANDLSKPPLILDPSANHGAVCLIAGEDYYVGCNAAAGVVAYRLSDGTPKVLLSRPNAFEYGHVSGRGPKPTLSNYDTASAADPGRDQIVALNFDGTIEPFGWAHHLSTDYVTQPHAAMDRTGKRALFMGWDSGACIVERP